MLILEKKKCLESISLQIWRTKEKKNKFNKASKGKEIITFKEETDKIGKRKTSKESKWDKKGGSLNSVKLIPKWVKNKQNRFGNIVHILQVIQG